MAEENTTRRIIEIDTRLAANALAHLKETEKSVSNVERAMESGMETIKHYAGAIVAGLSIHAAFEGIKGALEDMDHLNKEIQKVGIGAEEFQKLKYAADLADVSGEALEKGLVKLNRGLDGVDTAGTEAAKALRELGVTGTDTASTAFAKIADAFKNSTDHAHILALSQAALGKGFAEMIPLLNLGSEGLKEMGDEAESMGLIMSGRALEAAEEFNDTLKKLHLVGEVAFKQLSVGLLPALQAISEALFDTVKGGDSFQSFGEGLGEVAVFVSGKFINLAAAVRMLGIGMAGLVFALHAPVQDAVQNFKNTFRAMDEESDKAALKVAALQAKFQRAKEDMNKPATTKPNIPGSGATDDTEKKLEDWEKEIERLRTATATAKEELRLLGGGFPVDEAKAFAAETIKYKEALIGEFGEGKGGKIFDEITASLYRQLEAQHALTAENEARAAVVKALADQEKALAKAREDEEKDAAAREQARFDKLDKYRDEAALISDPGKDIKDKIADITREYEAGALSLSAYDALTEDLSHKLAMLGDSLDTGADAAKKFHEDFVQAVSTASEEASKALVDFATGTEGNFKEMFANMLKQFATFEIQKKAMQPLFTAGASAIEGFASSLFGPGAGAGAAPAVNYGSGAGFMGAHGGVFDQTGLVPFGHGGIVDRPTLFSFAHGGVGQMGEAGTEAILPLVRDSSGNLGVTSSGGGGSTVVNIFNNSSGTTVKTEKKPNASGGMDISVMIEDIMAKGLGSGKFDGVLQSNYGVMRQGRV